MDGMPERDDIVAKWLKMRRDGYSKHSKDPCWNVIDNLLDEYRTRADYGKPLLVDNLTDCP